MTQLTEMTNIGKETAIQTEMLIWAKEVKHYG